jgi:hypothetical protein
MIIQPIVLQKAQFCIIVDISLLEKKQSAICAHFKVYQQNIASAGNLYMPDFTGISRQETRDFLCKQPSRTMVCLDNYQSLTRPMREMQFIIDRTEQKIIYSPPVHFI